MVTTEHLIAFAVASFVLIVIPGPSVLFVVGRALAHGRRVAITSVTGNALGAYVIVAAVAAGIGTLVERSVVVFTGLKLAGAAYLIYLGVQAWRHHGTLRTDEDRASPTTFRTLTDGFVVGVANPKTIVFFAAVLPQFVDPTSGQVPQQMLLLGLVFTVIALISDSIWGLAAAGARSWFVGSPRRLATVGRIGGLSMIGLGLTVAVTGRKDQGLF